MQAALYLDDRVQTQSPCREPAKILCVDDIPANLVAIRAILGEPGLEIVEAKSGTEALRRLLHGEFAVVLMDVNMPDMDGFETARLIRQRPRSLHTPIIFLTASESDQQQIAKGYTTGAVDYLCKPLVPEILRAKVSVFVEIYQKSEQLRIQAELVRRLQEEEHQRQLASAREQYEAQRLRQEIELARQIQQKLFPVPVLPLPGFDISGASYPAEATGGDYFDYIPLRDGGLGLAVADVSGHGFGPALLMAELRAYLRAFLLARDQIGDVISLLNRALVHDAPAGFFATLLFGRLDPETRCFSYVSAGHVPGYLFRPSGEIKAVLKASSFPLGVDADEAFPVRQTPPLETGDVLLLLTDGIHEAHGSDQEMFGMERVLDFVRSRLGQTAREMLDGLCHSIRNFCGPEALSDDMTGVIVKCA